MSYSARKTKQKPLSWSFSLPSSQEVVDIEIKYTSRRGSIGVRSQLNASDDLEFRLFIPNNWSAQTVHKELEHLRLNLSAQIEQARQQWQQIQAKKPALPASSNANNSFAWLDQEWSLEWGSSEQLEQYHWCDGSKTLRVHPNFQQYTIDSVLENALAHKAVDWLQLKTSLWAQRIGVSVRGIEIKTYKSRWGSCTYDGRIQFNWKLLHAPEWVVEYVVVHELCHRIHMNHSKAYWQLVHRHYPRTEEAKRYLKDHSQRLMMALNHIEL